MFLFNSFEPFYFGFFLNLFELNKPIIRMVDSRADETRHRDVEFITTQMGRDVPVIGGYIFLPKDKERRRFQCRTRKCHASVTLMSDADGPYYTNVMTHNHPTHDEVVREMRHKQELRLAAKARSSQHTPTQQVAIDVRLKTKTSRRLSTDARFTAAVARTDIPQKRPRDRLRRRNNGRCVVSHGRQEHHHLRVGGDGPERDGGDDDLY